MKNRILLIGDLPCYGKMAINAMLPIFSHLGFDVSVLPTALVSNNFAYGKFDVLDTTDFMEKTLNYWDELGFEFDAVYTGFLSSKAQSELIADKCVQWKRRGMQIFSDPIMGDHGRLYNGVTQDHVENMRHLIGASDFIVPNLTEACYLAEIPCPRFGFDAGAMNDLMEKLKRICPGTILITSAVVDNRRMVYGHDAHKNIELELPYTQIDREFHGTGDVFTALFMAARLKGGNVEESACYAMEGVANMIRRNFANENVFDGLRIEGCLDLL